MKIKRWNYITREFDLQEIPDDPMFSTYEDSMDTTVKCISCGAKIHYASSYTSREILSEHNFGYCICMNCFNQESRRYNSAEDNLPPLPLVASNLFNSEEEFKVFEKLYTLQEKGLIQDLKLHPEITVRDSYTDVENGYVESIRLHAVFSYTRGNFIFANETSVPRTSTYVVIQDIEETTLNYVKEHCPSLEIIPMEWGEHPV